MHPVFLQRRKSLERAMRPLRARQCGFTLIELIVMIIIMGVLSVYALPRLFTPSDFDAFGFHGETLSYLRYAQKTAIAQRRTVCVAFTLSSVSLTISSAPSTNNCATTGVLIGPKGESGTVTLNAKAGVSFSSLPTAFYFDAQGQPITTAGMGAAQGTQTIQVSGVAKSITIETATGYVHE
jgi:MSHA pilin protein MshC